MTPKVRITVWSDYVCPFCYLEMPVISRIREEFGDAVEVDWRAFELRPEPVPTLEPDGEYLHRVWNASVYPMARERGLALKLPPVQPRSRRAMELAEYARTEDKFDEAHKALFQAFFEGGRDLDDLGVLLDIAGKIGLDGEAARTALEQGTYRQPVLQDQREAAELGVQGVPLMVIGRAGEPIERGIAVSGAQPYAAVKAAVQRMQAEG
jgi:predicted DsbA family dithiol-disulfide isomerase